MTHVSLLPLTDTALAAELGRLAGCERAEVFDRALTLLVADLKRRKFAATSRPRPSQAADSGMRTPSAAVRREVTARDGGGCAFVSGDGHRCGERRFVEFHHVWPFAFGGGATADNIELRCRAHNGHEVDLFFGPGTRRTRESPHAKRRSGGIACSIPPPPPSTSADLGSA